MKRKNARDRSFAALVGCGVAVLTGCGGGARQEPAREPETQYGQPPPPAQAAPAEAAEESSGGAQAPAAAPMPGSAPQGYGPQKPGYGRQQQPTSTGPSEEARDDAAESNIDGLTDALDRALALSAPDCASGAVLRDQICDLSTAICRLSGDKPADGELRNRCADAQNRCDKARSRVKASCP
jgi:hypothetical protein